MHVLDLFSGIGGFSLGLERAGLRTVGFCECDEYCRRVLRKHWPDVPVWGDVRTLTAEVIADANSWRQPQRKERNGQSFQSKLATSQRNDAERLDIDVIAGGFPCQDISVAGKGVGIEGERSGLWKEFGRIIGEVRPRYVIVENVAALLGRGLERVLGDLAALGYDAEWHCIPACAVGAPHRRDRVWVVAYPSCSEWGSLNSARGRVQRSDGLSQGQQGSSRFEPSGEDVADADQSRLEGWLATSLRECAEQRFAWAGGFQGWDEERWFAQSGMGRVAHGVPARVDRLRSLGNSIVPQIAEIIGRAIIKYDSVSDC